MAALAVIIQARIWAKRFPGKVLADLGGETVLQHVIRRANAIKGNLPVVVATPDLALIPIIRTYGAIPYLGDEENVLRRFVECAESFGIDAVLRLTGDCPFIDPWVMSELVDLWMSGKYDYVSNVLDRSYPYGLDCEIVRSSVLRNILANTQEKKYIEHVTLYIREHLEQFRTANLKNDFDATDFDWRLDKPEDLPYLRAIFKGGGGVLLPFQRVLLFILRTWHGAEHIRVPLGAGGSPGGDTASHGSNADAAGSASHQPGIAWYERGSGVKGPS